MNRRALIIALVGAGVFLVAFFGYYLPQHRGRTRAEAEEAAASRRLRALEAEIRDRPPEPEAEIGEAAGRFRDRVPRELNVTRINEALVGLCRTSGDITLESITELSVREREEEGVRKLPIRLLLRASYPDFARLLDAIDRSGLPLAVETFTVSNPDNVSILSRVELTVAACADPELR